jgi:hypothetical protein
MKKKHLSFWEIWNMSFGFLGIQFGFALQNANVSRIFETLGAKVEDIPILWIAAPLTGLIVQPNSRTFQRQNVEQIWSSSALFYDRSHFHNASPLHYAQFAIFVGSCRNALDYGCVDQYLDGTV